MENLSQQEIYKKLENLYNESEEKIKTDAMVRRAYIDRVSQDTINEKVNSQMNAIKAGIYDINPKFKEGSKNYDVTKKLVSETLSNYEHVLIEFSEFFDGKIEQLILRKVELESSLVGAIINEEYLGQKIIKKNEQKENDSEKRTFKDNIKMAIEKVRNQRENDMKVDPMVISKILDQQDIVVELDQKLLDKVELSIQDKKDNKDLMEKIEKEINMIDSEIDRINERKKKSIIEAMEVGSRAVTINIRKPKMFKKITRFFVSRFNTARIIETTIIDPLNLRIESFKNNELASQQ